MFLKRLPDRGGRGVTKWRRHDICTVSKTDDVSSILSYCCHSFPRLCIWGGCTIILCHLDGLVQDCGNSSALAMELKQSCVKPTISYICIRETPGLCFNYWCAVCGACKWSGTLPLFAHYAISLSSSSLSEGIELLKCLSGICCRVCV